MLELAKPRGVADAVIKLRQQNVGCPSARLLRSRVARPREGLASKNILRTVGGLTQFLKARSREALQQAALLKLNEKEMQDL